jgi:hypothetical protein
MRYYAISILDVGDFTHVTDENVVDFNQIIYDRYPDLVGSYRISVMITTRDPDTHWITSIMSLSMRITLP